MRPRRPSRRCRGLFRLLAVGAAVLGLGGCGSGDTVVLTPVPTVCDRPPDTSWRCLIPVCGGEEQRDGVWLTDDRVVIVGTGGLVLNHDRHGWRRQQVPDVGAFNVACATTQDIIVALSNIGSVVIGSNDRWSEVELGLTQSWRETVAVGDEVWAVGYGGQVLTGSVPSVADGLDPGNWTLLPPPGISDLTGLCVTPDTVFVCGEQRLLAWVDQTWSDVTPSRLMGENIDSIVSLDDGRLLAHTDTLYARYPEGWLPVEVDGWPYLVDDPGRVRYRHHTLYLDPLRTSSGSVQLLRPRGRFMEIEYMSTRGYGNHAVPRDSLTLLAFSETGGLSWYVADESVANDPNGLHRDLNVIEFNDGGQYLFSDLGQFYLDGTDLIELEPITGLSSNSLAVRERVCGASIDDFYYLSSSALLHCRNGDCQEVYRFERWLSGGQFAVDSATGDVYIGSYFGLYRWDGSTLTVLLGTLPDDDVEAEIHYEVRRTGAGTVVAWSSTNEVFIVRSGNLVSQGIQTAFHELLQGPDDPLLALCSCDLGACLYAVSADTAQIEMVEFEFEPTCPNLNIREIIDKPTGVYILTRNHSSVYRAEGDLRSNNWNLVAGPLDDYIEQLLIQPDGALAAVSSDDRLYLYQPDPWPGLKERR